MEYIQLDWISMTIGYVSGVFFCWTLCEVIYGEKNDC